MGKKEIALRRLIFFGFIGLAFGFFPSTKLRGAGERIVAIRSDGTLETEGGRKIVLGGITLPEEGVKILSVLIASREIEIKTDDDFGEASEGNVLPVYAYTSLHEADFPLKAGDEPRKNKVLLNEFLISLGAARVREDISFKWRDRFLKLQETARQEGRGIWSYQEEEKKI